MSDYIPIHIDGERVISAGGEAIDVINPATEQHRGANRIGIANAVAFLASDHAS